MRTPDFEAYDDFKEITGNCYGNGNTFTTSFRAVMVSGTHTGAAGATFQIQQLGGSSGAIQNPKSIILNTGTNGGSMILPVSGDWVILNGITGPTTRAYVLF